MFTLEQFIDDLRGTLSERSRRAMKDVVARAVSEPDAVVRAIGAPGKAGVQILHRSPELTVLNVVWAPNQVTLPHDHRMTAVIGMYGGREDNMFWRRLPGARRFQIEPAGGEALGTGDVALLGRDIVHSVINPLPRLSAAIHVYDGPFLTVGRSMWDAESLTEQPYDVNAVAKGMAVQVSQPAPATAGG
jgi:predicted metal-dependent enzyme (double-stranded beta helix superfamily)